MKRLFLCRFGKHLNTLALNAKITINGKLEKKLDKILVCKYCPNCREYFYYMEIKGDNGVSSHIITEDIFFDLMLLTRYGEYSREIWKQILRNGVKN